MHSKLSVIVLIIALFAASIDADYVQSKVSSQANLLNFMEQNRDLSKQHPQRSLDCFSYYVPILNKVTANYENNYNICINQAVDSENQIDESTKDQRNSLQYAAKDACELLSNCNHYSHSITYLDCYINGGTQNSKTMYNISLNASNILFNIREKIQLIQNDKYRCTNESERIYIEESANTFDDLQGCILGHSYVPEPTTDVPEITPQPVTTTSTPEVRKLATRVLRQRSMPEKEIERYSIMENVKKFKRFARMN